jgi:hypothetical protein
MYERLTRALQYFASSENIACQSLLLFRLISYIGDIYSRLLHWLLTTLARFLLFLFLVVLALAVRLTSVKALPVS